MKHYCQAGQSKCGRRDGISPHEEWRRFFPVFPSQYEERKNGDSGEEHNGEAGVSEEILEGPGQHENPAPHRLREDGNCRGAGGSSFPVARARVPPTAGRKTETTTRQVAKVLRRGIDLLLSDWL